MLADTPGASSLLGAGCRTEGFLERLEAFAAAAPRAGPGACCLSKLSHCQLCRLGFHFIFFITLAHSSPVWIPRPGCKASGQMLVRLPG